MATRKISSSLAIFLLCGRVELALNGGQDWHRYARPSSFTIISKRNVMHHYVSVFLAISVLQVNMHTLITKKKTRNCESCITLRLMRRALDSNQRIPYDIGSLANCWFKPLTQPSLNHLFCKRAVQIYNLFSNVQNFKIIFVYLLLDLNPLNIFL